MSRSPDHVGDRGARRQATRYEPIADTARRRLPCQVCKQPIGIEAMVVGAPEGIDVYHARCVPKIADLIAEINEIDKPEQERTKPCLILD